MKPSRAVIDAIGDGAMTPEEAAPFVVFMQHNAMAYYRAAREDTAPDYCRFLQSRAAHWSRQAREAMGVEA